MAFTPWYKEMSVYHIWPRSFCDGNGDGIGDLWGVLSKLDYIKSLNVDAIWFSPLYPSPNADYGYDISDYMNIHPDYGNLDVFRQVLDGAHERGLRVFMDLVVNHSSDEHPWFKESRKSKDSPYHDYYFWRPGRRGGINGKKLLPPNNWTSLFEGGAWEYDSSLDEFYLHLFAKKQPDLNMDNPAVREEVKKILRFWLDMGVDGFREDVITFVSKAPGLPDAYPKLPAANGMKYYSNRPEVHAYLKEFKRDVFNNYDCFVVGESPMTTADVALSYVTEGPEHVLDEMIAFSHMEADCFYNEVLPSKFNLVKMKKAFTDWQLKLEGRGWNALYIENHDHPRIISRYGSEKYHDESGKMLAAMYILQRGTPFIYQGQELGMTNCRFDSIEEYDDISTKDQYQVAIDAGCSREEALRCCYENSRDNARTPMQWDSTANGGFTTGTPWIAVNPNAVEINVQRAREDENSILHFYRRLIALRRGSDILKCGDFQLLVPDDSQLFAYRRSLDGADITVWCNFSPDPCQLPQPVTGTPLLSEALTHTTLAPYGFVVISGQ